MKCQALPAPPSPFQPIKPVFTVISQNGRRKICKRRNISARSSLNFFFYFRRLLGRFVCAAHGWIDATYAICQRLLLLATRFPLFVFLPSVCTLCVSHQLCFYLYNNFRFAGRSIFVSTRRAERTRRTGGRCLNATWQKWRPTWARGRDEMAPNVGPR